ncbi:MAG: SufS family cysteine desulfurase [Myxococcota bacterium]
MMTSLADIRNEFPALQQHVHGHPLVYLDNASTTQKPRCVLDTIQRSYASEYANVHRGVHSLSQRATEAYESVRYEVAEFINASDPREVIFTAGATSAINLVAQTLGRSLLGPHDEVLVTEMEHHSNLVPWQVICAERGARLRVLEIDDKGDLKLDQLEDVLGKNTRIVALAHISNTLGTVNPVEHITKAARRFGARVVVDGAQAVSHCPVDVQSLGCDFYAFSAHKAYGPSGVGVLWGRLDLLEGLPPWQSGGDMVLSVDLAGATYNEVPHRFEAGTPNIVGVVGMGAALRWIREIGFDSIMKHEDVLLHAIEDRLGRIGAVRRIGTSSKIRSSVSFLLGDVHAHDVGTILDGEGIAVRAGHHCTQPVMDHFDVDATVRASVAIYNTVEEIDRLADGLKHTEEVFR